MKPSLTYPEKMKIVLAGGTGQVGTFLAEAFQREGHKVVVLSRNPTTMPWRTTGWDGKSPGAWCGELENADAVINLAGRSVNCRYGMSNRRAILDSRILSTRAIGHAVKACSKPPQLWINSSTATIYSHRYDGANDEEDGILDTGEKCPGTWKFSVDVAKAWESAMNEVHLPETRKVQSRMAMVMGAGRGGVFDVFSGLARKGLGGTLGNGRQYVSWIHELDFYRSVDWIIRHPTIEGPVNICSPEPVPNRDFMAGVRDAVGVGFGMPAREWMLEIGAFFLRTETELLLKSRRVVPSKLLQSGFEFRYPKWDVAAKEIHARLRAGVGFDGKWAEQP